MSAADSEDGAVGGFAPPPFDAAQALQRLDRELRALGLSARAGQFERRGLAVAKAAVSADQTQVDAALVLRPQRSGPQWQPRALKTHAELRQFVEELKKKLSAWSDRDD